MRKPIFIWLVTTTMVSCYTQNKATRQVWKARALQPKVVARICSDIYTMPTDSSFVSEVLLKGDTFLISDTVINVDTITGLIYKNIHHTKYVTDTFFRNRYVQVQNSAAKDLLQNKLTTKNDELIRQQQLLKVWRLIAIICALLIIAWLAIRIWV